MESIEDFAVRLHAGGRSEKNSWIRTSHLLLCYQVYSRFVFIHFSDVLESPQLKKIRHKRLDL